MNWLKTIKLLRLLILVNQFRKTDYNTKINEFEKKTFPKFNRLRADNFADRLKQVSLENTNDILLNFVIKADFEDKLKSINKNVTSNKTKHIEVNKKLDDLEKKLN